MTDYTGIVAEHLQRVKLENIPDEAIQRSKLRLLDSIGNAFAGWNATGNAGAFSVLKGYGGTEQATVVGRGVKLPAPHAALLNAMAMRSYDFEAVGAESADASMVPAHISGTTVPVALATADRFNVSGEQFLEALILGEDLASRLAVASGFHTASGGDNTGTVNVMGGAAIAGKLQGFDVRQYRDALGHALNQMAGTVQSLFDKALSFKLPQSLAARNAVFAADLAAAGFTGPDDAIGAPFGFFKLFSPAPEPESLIYRMGEDFFADMIIKPWASCRAAHPALDATLRLREKHRLRAEEIHKVEVHVTGKTKSGFTGQDFSEAPGSEVDGLFSIPYNVAVGLLEGTVRPEHLLPAYMRQERVRRMVDLVELVDSMPSNEYQTAEVSIHTRGGSVVHERVEEVRGDIYRNALPEDEVLEKFYLNVSFSGLRDAAEADNIVETIKNVESLKSMHELTEILS